MITTAGIPERAAPQPDPAGGSGVEATLPSRLLTVDELAAFLAVSVAWVRKGVLERTLPHTKIGRNVRFTPQQVAEILAEGQRPPVRHEPARRSRGSARTRL